MHRPSSLIVAALVLTTLTACGSSTVYRPGATAGFDFHNPPSIDDADIQKAFDARPQLGAGLKVAYYSFDPNQSDDIEKMLEDVPNVAGTYAIPSLMATGTRRFETRRAYWEPKPEFSLKKLRLLAARAHCDVLLIFDYGYKVETTPNGLVALNALLVPVFFSPFLDQEIESYLDAYVIDVRNGYLYAHATSDEKTTIDYETIWSDKSEKRVEKQWQALITRTGGNLAEVVRPDQAAAALRPTIAGPPAPPE